MSAKPEMYSYSSLIDAIEFNGGSLTHFLSEMERMDLENGLRELQLLCH